MQDRAGRGIILGHLVACEIQAVTSTFEPNQAPKGGLSERRKKKDNYLTANKLESQATIHCVFFR